MDGKRDKLTETVPASLWKSRTAKRQPCRPVIDGAMSTCLHLAGRAYDLGQGACLPVCSGAISWGKK